MREKLSNAAFQVAKAAAALQWSQPTVAHHLRTREAELGSAVVVAQASGTSLTPVGAELLPHADAVLERLERAQHEVRAFAETGRRRVRLGVFPTIAVRFLPGVVRGLRERGYDVVIREAEVDLLRAELTELRTDAALVYTTATDARPELSDFHTRNLFDDPLDMMLPAGHRLAGADRVALSDFASDDWILSAYEHEPLGALLRDAAASAEFSPRAAARSDDYRVIAAYVAAGLGVALVPRSAVPESEHGRSGVARVPLTSPALYRRVQLITSPALAPETVTVLLETLADAGASGIHSSPGD